MAVASRKIGKYSKWDDIDASGEIEGEMNQEIIDEIERRIIMNVMAQYFPDT